ncbi:MAG: dodecin domain-containing protein [Euryarchaeota archaeon]|nr:dodecin domain-containing protein [Euryarchaeota archaeon]
MAPSPRTQTQNRTTNNDRVTHEHRTAKVVELIGASTKSFEDAIQTALNDASDSIRGITGAHVENLSVKFTDGRISEYKANLKVAFGIERTNHP